MNLSLNGCSVRRPCCLLLDQVFKEFFGIDDDNLEGILYQNVFFDLYGGVIADEVSVAEFDSVDGLRLLADRSRFAHGNVLLQTPAVYKCQNGYRSLADLQKLNDGWIGERAKKLQSRLDD